MWCGHICFKQKPCSPGQYAGPLQSSWAEGKLQSRVKAEWWRGPQLPTSQGQDLQELVLCATPVGHVKDAEPLTRGFLLGTQKPPRASSPNPARPLPCNTARSCPQIELWARARCTTSLSPCKPPGPLTAGMHSGAAPRAPRLARWAPL